MSLTINDFNTIGVRRYHAYQLDVCSNWTTRTVYEPNADDVIVSYRDLRTIDYHRDCQQP